MCDDNREVIAHDNYVCIYRAACTQRKQSFDASTEGTSQGQEQDQGEQFGIFATVIALTLL